MRRVASTVGCRLVSMSLFVATVGCLNETATSSRSSSILVVDRLAASGDDGATRTLVQSDVVTEGVVRDDRMAVTFRLDLKDPGGPEQPTAPTSVNVITVSGYRVRYRRTDGRDEAGVDVPHAFDGAVTVAVGSEPVTVELVVVRASAKLEAPLRPLIDGGGSIVLHAVADLTFFAHDQTGAPIRAVGQMDVQFADWTDETTGPRAR